MAQTVISPVTTRVDRGVYKVVAVIPTTVDATGATADFTLSGRPLAIGFQGVSSNFNGKTLSLQGSNDGTNFAALPTAVSLTATGIASVAAIDVAYAYYRINITGAPAATLTVTIIASTHP